MSLLPLQWKASHLTQDAEAPGVLLALVGPQGLDLQFSLPPQQPQGVGIQGLGGQPAEPAPQLLNTPHPPAGPVCKQPATSPSLPPYSGLMAATCVALGLVSFRLAGATRSAGVSSGGFRWPLSASPSTGDWRASSLASPASGQDLGAIFDVLGGSERVCVWGVFPVCQVCGFPQGSAQPPWGGSPRRLVCVSTPGDTRLWVMWVSTPGCFWPGQGSRSHL